MDKQKGSKISLPTMLTHFTMGAVSLLLVGSGWLNTFDKDLWMIATLVIAAIFTTGIMAALEEFYGLGFLNEKFLRNCRTIFFGIMPMIYLSVLFGTIYWSLEIKQPGSFDIDEPKNLLNFLFHSSSATFSFNSLTPNTFMSKFFVLSHSILNLILVLLFLNKVSEVISKDHEE